MVSKWTFFSQLFWFYISFKDNLCCGRHFHINCLTFNQFNPCFSYHAGKEEFIYTIREGCCCSISHHRVCPYCNCHFHPLPCLSVFIVVHCTILMYMPVHTCGFFIIHLHPIHTDIPLSTFKTLCKDYR